MMDLGVFKMETSEDEITDINQSYDVKELNITRFYFLGGMLIFQGVVGYLLLIARVFSSHSYDLFSSAIILSIPLPPLLVGIMICRQKYIGIWLAIILCVIQLPYLEVNSHVLSCRLGLAYVLRFSVGGYEVGVNLVALLILYTSIKFYPNMINHKNMKRAGKKVSN